MTCSPRNAVLWCVLALGAAVPGCKAQGLDALGLAVVLDLSVDPSVGDARLATVTALRISSDGDEQYDHTFSLGRPLSRAESEVYRPLDRTRTLSVRARALDGQGQVVASGDSGVLTLSPSTAVRAPIVLRAESDSMADGAVPLDLSTADGAVPPDMRMPYAQVVLADSPLLFYRFDEATGSGGIIDSSLSHLNGVYDGTSMQYRVPGALAGDPSTAVATKDTGDPGYLSFDPLGNTIFSFLDHSPFSLEVWLAPKSYDLFVRNLWSCRDNPASGTQGYELVIDRPNNQIGVQRWVNGVGVMAAGPLVPLDVFSHLVGTYDGSALRMYVNGVKVAEVADARAQSQPSVSCYLYVAGNASGGHPMYAAFDEMAIYNAALSEQQIMNHYLAAH